MSHCSETIKKEIVQHMFRFHLDLIILRIVQEEDTWGYKIMRKIKEDHSVAIRHSSLYPLLNDLEREGLLRSRESKKYGRTRRIYSVTSKGEVYIDTYRYIFNELLGSPTP
jgi:PadR family transcriptional regulator PadR